MACSFLVMLCAQVVGISKEPGVTNMVSVAAAKGGVMVGSLQLNRGNPSHRKVRNREFLRKHHPKYRGNTFPSCCDPFYRYLQ